MYVNSFLSGTVGQSPTPSEGKSFTTTPTQRKSVYRPVWEIVTQSPTQRNNQSVLHSAEQSISHMFNGIYSQSPIQWNCQLAAHSTEQGPRGGEQYCHRAVSKEKGVFLGKSLLKYPDRTFNFPRWNSNLQISVNHFPQPKVCLCDDWWRDWYKMKSKCL